MVNWLCRFFLKRVSRAEQVLIAKGIVEEIQMSKDYAINDVVAEKIIEAVVKSSGNKITDFIVAD